MVLPCDDNIMRKEVQARPYSRAGRFDALPHEIEMGLVRIIQHEVDFIRRVAGLSRELAMRPDYSAHAAFNTIDRYQEGSINIANLQEFFRSFGNYLIEQEIFAIVRRIDTDGDGRINMFEFAELFKTNVDVALPMGNTGKHN